MTSQNDAILERLKQHEGEWVPMPVLSRAPCKYGLSQAFATHSRINDLRGQGYDIDNKVESENGRRKSYYRLNVGQSELFQPEHQDAIGL